MRFAQKKKDSSLKFLADIVASKKRVIIVFSPLLSKEKFMMRLLCLNSGIDCSDMDERTIPKSEWPKLTFAADNLCNSKLYIDDSSNLTLLEMKKRIERLRNSLATKKLNIDLVVIYTTEAFLSGNPKNKKILLSQIMKIAPASAGLMLL
ncbi:MAG: hypothetical protein CVU77_06150 [Elusimicrobia bacterium HGW-Elusimicrobia-1]|jgi:replicative DNA helicase|nr:MAG: hypothetical protein CVU79_08265 [Elusimicrobia bacterium HGW-Elusimicrobia-3]PKN01261.1 MAG: hypothetical protein CVU77_06150 [Elusimicrobia bacterium HGW-Elusimicrobia-1]